MRTAEHGTARLPRALLTEHDLAVLSAIGNGYIRCSPTAGGWELRVGAVCGVLELDRCRLVVRPKLIPDGPAVISWIGYAMTAPVGVESVRRWTVDRGGLRDVIVAALVDECTELLRGGLHRDYRRRAAVDTVLRGRLDFGRQVSSRFGQVDLLHMHRFDRQTDVWENVVCRVALDAAVRVAVTPELRRSARELAQMFPAGSADPATARRWIATARYHRMNARYRPSHVWAGLLLGVGGVSDLLADGPWNAGSLLIKMNALWERIVQRVCQEVSLPQNERVPGPPRIVMIEPGQARRAFLPDAVILASDDGEAGTYLPVDAKYKDYGVNALGRDDAHQLLTYASAFRRPSAAHGASLVVHPVIGASGVRAVEVCGGAGRLGTVVVVGVDAARTPEHAANVVRQAVQEALHTLR